jgi:hypothetical protein
MRILIALAFVCLAFVPVAANANDQDGQMACMNDAMTVCGQFIPDRERVAGCLIANRSRISVACRTALARFNKSASRSKATSIR